MLPRDFDRFVHQVIGFARAADLANVPDSPGVYAWFPPVELPAHDTLASSLDALSDNLHQLYHALTSVEGLVGQHQIGVQVAAPSFDTESDAVRALSSEIGDEARESLQAMFLALSFIGGPMYVGMARGTDGLRGRLRGHLTSGIRDPEWTGNLRARVGNRLDDPSYLRRCVIAFVAMDSLPESARTERFVEHVLLRVFRPWMSKRG